MSDLNRDGKIHFIMFAVGVAPDHVDLAKSNYAKLSDQEIDARYKKWVEIGARIEKWRETRSPI